jgi:glycosyltransferase involved in cell wall biosynthesis
VGPNIVEHYAPWTGASPRRGNAPAALTVVRAQLERARRERGRIDLIHAHVSFPAGWLAMRLSSDTGIPFVLTEHMSPFPFTHFERDGRVVPEVAEPLRHARRVTAVSRALAEQIREKTGVEAEVIPNGVDETLFAPGPSRGGPFTFLTVGAIETQKGIDVLLTAAAQLRRPPAAQPFGSWARAFPRRVRTTPRVRSVSLASRMARRFAPTRTRRDARV